MTEHPFMKHLMIVLGARPDLKVWRQNCGKIAIRDARGKIDRVFDAGPPKGAADISGIVRPEGWRLEIEVKGPRGRRSPEQVRWSGFIESSGGVYALVGYDEARSLDENVAAAVKTIEIKIGERRLWLALKDGTFRTAFNAAMAAA